MRISAAEGAEIIIAAFQDGEPSPEESEELEKLRTVVTNWRRPDLTENDSHRLLTLYQQVVGEVWDSSLERPERVSKAKIQVNDIYSLGCDSHGWTLSIGAGKGSYSRYYSSLEGACLGIADHAGRKALTEVDHLLEVITAIQQVKDEIATALDRLAPPVPYLRETPLVAVKRKKGAKKPNV